MVKEKQTAKNHNGGKSLRIAAFFVALFCIGFFGMVVYHSGFAPNAKETTTEILVGEIQKTEEENSELTREIADLQRESDNISLNQSFDSETITDLENAIAALKEGAGYTEITSEGIVVELNDNSEEAQKAISENTAGYHSEDYIVHDKNLLYLINEMRRYATNICVNDQRIVTGSTIRCVGSVIMVNQARVAPPYHLQFGGDSATLMKALKNCDTYDALLASPLIVNISAESSLVFPAYNGTVNTEGITVTETEVP